MNSAGQVAVDPLQFVAITGSSIDIASTCGRPHPSPAAWLSSSVSLVEKPNDTPPPQVLNFHTPNYRARFFKKMILNASYTNSSYFETMIHPGDIYSPWPNGERLEWVRQRHRLLCRVLEDLSRPNPWRRALVGKMFSRRTSQNRSPKIGRPKKDQTATFLCESLGVFCAEAYGSFFLVESVLLLYKDTYPNSQKGQKWQLQ